MGGDVFLDEEGEKEGAEKAPLHRSHMHMQKEPNCPSLETNHSGFYKPHYRT